MKILGIDPGDTTGWCLYDTEARRVIASGDWEGCYERDYAEALWPSRLAGLDAICAIVERPRAYGTARPDVVEVAVLAGEIRGKCHEVFPYSDYLLRKSRKGSRDSVCSILSDEVGCVTVSDDATAWSAIVELHGGVAAAKKAKRKAGKVIEEAGPLGTLVGSHQKAACAVAVAYAIKRGWFRQEAAAAAARLHGEKLD